MKAILYVITLMCSDFRNVDLGQQLKDKGLIDPSTKVYILAVPGGVHKLVHGHKRVREDHLKDVEDLLQVRAPDRPKQLIVAYHKGCGKYRLMLAGKSEEQRHQTQEQDAKEAARILEKRFGIPVLIVAEDMDTEHITDLRTVTSHVGQHRQIACD